MQCKPDEFEHARTSRCDRINMSVDVTHVRANILNRSTLYNMRQKLKQVAFSSSSQ